MLGPLRTSIVARRKPEVLVDVQPEATLEATPDFWRGSVPRRQFFRFTAGAGAAALIGRGGGAATAAILGANPKPLSETRPTPVATAFEPVKSLESVQEIVGELVRERFPELAGVAIEIEPNVDEPYYSFEARPKSLFRSIEDGGLLIRVNRRMFDLDCPRYMIEAVLAHELSHGVWYAERGSSASLAGGMKYVFERTGFEKATDLEAVRRGYGAGLAAHRRWLAERFPEQVKERASLYLSPEEIERAMGDRTDPLWQVWSGEFDAGVGRTR